MAPRKKKMLLNMKIYKGLARASGMDEGEFSRRGINLAVRELVITNSPGRILIKPISAPVFTDF